MFTKLYFRFFKEKVLDGYSEKDFKYESLAGNISKSLPEYFLLNDNYFTDQGKTGRHRTSCVAFGTTNAVNETLFYNRIKVKKDPQVLADRMIDDGTLTIGTGAYVVDGPNTANVLERITGFAQCDNLKEIKQSIFNGRAILTGTNKFSFKSITNFPFIVKEGSMGGHAFIIVGYDDLNKWLICEDSYGKNERDNGRFYVPYNLFDKLFIGKYSIFHDQIENFKFLKEEIKRARELKYVKYSNLLVKEMKKDNNSIKFKVMQEAARIVFLKRK